VGEVEVPLLAMIKTIEAERKAIISAKTPHVNVTKIHYQDRQRTPRNLRGSISPDWISNAPGTVSTIQRSMLVPDSGMEIEGIEHAQKYSFQSCRCSRKCPQEPPYGSRSSSG
jgi:hypothetical protein